MSEALQMAAPPQEQGVLDRFRQSSIGNRVAILAAASSFGVAAEQFVAPESALASSATPNCIVDNTTLPSNGTLRTNTCNTVTATFAGSEQSDKDLASGSIKILANISTPMPKTQVRKLEREGKCITIGKGTNNPEYMNEGFNVENKHDFGRDDRRVRACYVGGVLTKVLCRNRIKLFNHPEVTDKPKAVFVRNFAHAKLSLVSRSTSEAHAVAKCYDTNGNEVSLAEGNGKGSGYAAAKIDIRTYIKTHGNSAEASRVIASAYGSAKTEADSKATASAVCISSTTTTESGSTTPTPPPQPPAETCATNPFMESCKINQPPTVQFDNFPAHNYPNGKIDLCVKTYDPNNDPLKTEIYATRGTVSSEFLKNPADPSITCVHYTAPGTTGDETILATTTDGKDAYGRTDYSIDASTSNTFPVIADQF
ncbi:MAG: hypothetical protein QFB86_02685 [Patescibacteria group bacterium]|nr:hypothetical protein [Patescibacteria group bacterium]